MSGLLPFASLIDIFPTFEPVPLVGLGLSRAAGLVILGDEVSFLRGPNDDAIVADPSYLLVRDVSGRHWDRCDLLILRAGFDLPAIGLGDVDVHQWAAKYYGLGRDLEDFSLAKPKGRWQARGRIDTLWYRRSGEYAGRYTHSFAHPLALESTQGGEFRLRLGDGCIANERGIVYP